MTQDVDLLERYVTDASQQAFGELVARHVDVVYASARRQLGNEALAQDVTQAVFVMLSQKAGTLRPDVVLAGWLLTATWFAAKNAMRKERRRRMHESEAASMTSESIDPTPPEAEGSAQLGRELDAALQMLSAQDRSAVVLHYLQGIGFAGVAQALQTTPEAARKRIERALAKLRAQLSRAGVELVPAAVAGALSATMATRAPEPLTGKIASAATAATAAIARDAASTMRWAKLKLPLITLTALGLSAGVGLVLLSSTGSQQRPARNGGSARTVSSQAATAPAIGPREVLAAFSDALQRDDIDRAMSHAVAIDSSGQPLLDEFATMNRLLAALKQAVREVLGDAEADALPWIARPQVVPPDARVEITGDRAVVYVEGGTYPMVAVDGVWKLPASATQLWVVPITDLSRANEILTPAQARHLAQLHNREYAALTDAVRGGEFTKSAEVHSALQERLSEAYEVMRRERTRSRATVR